MEEIFEERNTNLTGNVKCAVCGKMTKLGPPVMYTLRECSKVIIGRMKGFACPDCFKKQRSKKEEENR